MSSKKRERRKVKQKEKETSSPSYDTLNSKIQKKMCKKFYLPIYYFFGCSWRSASSVSSSFPEGFPFPFDDDARKTTTTGRRRRLCLLSRCLLLLLLLLFCPKKPLSLLLLEGDPNKARKKDAFLLHLAIEVDFFIVVLLAEKKGIVSSRSPRWGRRRGRVKRWKRRLR